MLAKHLDDAVSIINHLTKITHEDIAKIRVADHSMVSEHTSKKTALIKDFEIAKRALDAELVALSKANDGIELSDILEDEIKDKLAVLRESLTTLHAANKEYAKSVIIVKDFFDSMLKSVFGAASGYGSGAGYDASGYGSGTAGTTSEQIFKIRI